ncbi:MULTISPECIES: TetR/AcrR family transcriptional regulator [unclassified Streptomyces]|uniref:TetR/AcrR family transcriptional regulator n=1 Tax=unclassified Streptomyces TaxID=2593676 RepID=UPI0006F8A1DB|nr:MULTISPECIES: TetR/AcrR family transcriptional regulator [unclassified Streptomyces]KQX47481.1 TetR family transcriptional regulator [Streptomyces sp. Root1304]KRA94789.1 TetR family transcriptional regulator [Streptomyces sp. Root66D1]
MGHKEDLLEGAKRCLLEKGYGRTTARDIVAASGTNLASIGYHYGSKDALLQQAFLALTEEWGDRVTPPEVDGDEGGAPESSADPYERFHAVWARLIAAAEASRPVWKLQTEVVTRLDDDEKLRDAIKEPQREGRLGIAEGMLGIDPAAEPEKARVAGLLCQALATGVMIQWMVDPETAPSADDLTEGLRVLMEGQ